MPLTMKQIFLIVLGILWIPQPSNQASTPDDLFYNAGVVEFSPSSELNNFDRLQDNLNGYLEIIASEAAKSLDIIVFPEDTLNSNTESTFVPDPAEDHTIPCNSSANEYHNFLIQLSCAARNTTKYLVINLTEKEKCSKQPLDKRPCANSGLNLFNTHVVLDRSGAVISRYRKVHLYGENKNTTLYPEFGWFDTDFGVRFGHFICFDILFYSPAQELVDAFGIKDFIYSTMWFSQLPFLTAVQIHQAWSYGNDVNLLAAGASDPLIGTTGSGIYNGRNGILVATMQLEGKGVRSLYTAKVPKYQSNHVKKMSTMQTTRFTKPDIVLKRDYLQNYDSVLIDLYNQTTLSQRLCYAKTSFCCHFDLKWQQMKRRGDNSRHYHYRLGAYDGTRNEVAYELNAIKNCAIFSCSGSDILDCGTIYDIDTNVVFENITIIGNFPKNEAFVLMPNSLMLRDLMPVSIKDFEWTESLKESNVIRVQYTLKSTTPNIMAFSIYGNYYDSYKDEATSLLVSIFTVIFMVLVHSML